jgi:hypothetical protein
MKKENDFGNSTLGEGLGCAAMILALGIAISLPALITVLSK